MINYVKVTNPKGEFINLELRSPEKSGFFVRKIHGLGPAKSIINMGESLYEDGGFFNSARVTSRNIVFDLGFLNYEGETVEQIRSKSYRFFPMKTPLTLEINTDSRTGIITGYVETNEPDIFSKDEGTQISVVCPESYFSSKDILTTVFTGSDPAFEFPFENPSLTEKLIEFGNVFINTTANVFYSGDVPTGVIIYISFIGNVTTPVISNVSTGETFTMSSPVVTAITGSNFKLNDLVIISTIKNHKSVTLYRDGVGYNILNSVSVNSSWFKLTKGDNLFIYTASNGTVGNMQFEIIHQPLYEGL